MRGKKVKKSPKQEKLSMKEALKEMDVKDSKKQYSRNNIRDILWNYPIFVVKLFEKTVPFSYIFIFLSVAILSLLLLESNAIAKFLEGSKSKDTFIEGNIGAITSFNPLFVSTNYIDRTVHDLVFDKFIYINKQGEPIAGIAKGWNVSEDKLIYEFEIKDNIFWQDGTKLTIDDVLFTFQTAKSLAKDYSFDSVGACLVGVDIKKKDGKYIIFKLDEPNPTFFEAISIHIVPKAKLEEDDLSQLAFNMFARYPLGSGRYKVTRTDANAVYLSENEFDNYRPKIKNIVIKVFPDKESMEMAFRIGSLDAIGSWDKNLMLFTDEYPNLNQYEKEEEYRTKLIFFNTRKDFFKNREIREAINYLIDTEKLLEKTAVGANKRDGPFSSSSWAYSEGVEDYSYNPEKASELLKELGYLRNESSKYFEKEDGEVLSFTLSYLESPTNEDIVEELKDMLKKEGVVLKTEKLNYNQITQEIIATRDFDTLLYEIEISVDPDQYNLWHSLKSNYPDLNISGYSYERVDILLEDARKTVNQDIRKEKYVLFQKYFMADSPVIFLYNPTFIYFMKDNIQGIDLNNINYSYERFHNIDEWSMN